MFALWKKIDKDARLIQVLAAIIVFLMLANGLLCLGWLSAPKRMTVFVPPTLESGATLKPDHIPKSAVYAFTFYIWQVLNNWPKSGVVDYKKHLEALWPFFTPQCRQQLIEDYRSRLAQGALSRVRSISAIVDGESQISRVTRISHDAWHVNLTVHLSEWVNGTSIKDIEINYPLKVVRYDVNREINPWGLAISGFFKSPERIKTGAQKA